MNQALIELVRREVRSKEQDKLTKDQTGIGMVLFCTSISDRS